MNKSTQLVLFGAAIAVGALWLRGSLIWESNENTAGVSKVKGTNPVQPTKVAAKQVSPLELALSGVKAVLRPLLPSSATQTQNKLAPFQNATSARAAYNAPLRPEYRPSAYANLS